MFRGTLQEPQYSLATFYGTVQLPMDRVIGMLNVGDFRPRQLLVTSDGQVLGGKLQQEVIKLELSTGQTIQVPLSQITRIGYHKRPGEPEEWTFNQPMVLMRSGDRVGVQLPPNPIDVVTRYGLVKLTPESVAAIAFQTEEHGVHEVYLTDGSQFAGLVRADQFQMKLAGSGPEQMVSFPASAIVRLQLSAKSDEVVDTTPTMRLMNDDLLVGIVQGQLKLQTAFDTLTLNGPEIKRLARAKGGAQDVQVTLWDETTVSGQFEQQDLTCALKSGLSMSIPIALIEEYIQPVPQASKSMMEKIKTTAADLSAEDWKQRDRAEALLVGMGPAVIDVLKEIRPSQSPEAQQRIDSILKQLAKQLEKPRTGTPAANPAPPMPMDQ